MKHEDGNIYDRIRRESREASEKEKADKKAREHALESLTFNAPDPLAARLNGRR